jgi:hypothetical protein
VASQGESDYRSYLQSASIPFLHREPIGNGAEENPLATQTGIRLKIQNRGSKFTIHSLFPKPIQYV